MPDGYFAEDQLHPAARVEIEVWPCKLAFGESLPELPLSLGTQLVVPVNLDAAYTNALRRHRLLP